MTILSKCSKFKRHRLNKEEIELLSKVNPNFAFDIIKKSERKKLQNRLSRKVQMEQEYFKRTGKFRCITCKKDFIQEDKYTWKPNCSCIPNPNIRISIGGQK